uniref:FAD-dependent oxidoreductase n=1 Tax=Phenylobacterium glaciei TaxID=2803784 RepID=A0A974S7S2_9CAUL|nr:FAD-dependent oxidoreductase [Phenylobacterium glaciei]
MTERVLVIGAGIGGLCTALALASPERKLTLLERDPSPPTGNADAAFADWARRGWATCATATPSWPACGLSCAMSTLPCWPTCWRPAPVTWASTRCSARS